MADGKRFFGWVLLATTAVHVALAIGAPLSGDEAYYWDCSRHPDWAYFDQPPLVIWAMIPFRALLGETNLAVRAPAILASLILAVGLLGIVRRLGGGARDAGLAYLVLHGTPLAFLGSAYASTDIAMIAAYTLATWAAMAVADGDRRGWWGFALAIGLGFLAKFTIVLALAAIGAAVHWGQGRRHLSGPTPYLAAALALVLTSPVWIWAARHDWDNIRFQLVGRHHDSSLTLRFFGEFIAGNLVLLSPPLAIALVIAWARARRRGEPGRRVAAVAAATPILFFGVLSLGSRMAPHWGTAGVVVAVALLAVEPFRARRALVAGGIGLGLAIVAAGLTVVALPERLLELEWSYAGRPQRVSTSAAAELIGYPEIVEAVDARLRPGELVASSSYTTTHLLAYLSGGRLPTRLANVNRGRHGLASLYWYEPSELVGRDLLFVARDRRREFHEPLEEIFAEVVEEPPIEVHRDGRLIRSFRVLRCRNLRQPVPALTRLE
jgi:4-amino-4-deoxy-L-arabinose transferase-like glycosyltransferase